MKKDEVPQDPGSLLSGGRLTYAQGEDGRFEGVRTSGWEAEIAVTQVARERENQRIQAAFEAASKGELSALGYHMAAQQVDELLLSAETGVWRWRIRRCLKPAVFAKASDRLLSKFAHTLGKELAELRALPAEPELL